MGVLDLKALLLEFDGMSMQTTKKTKDYSILKKKSGRYAVLGADKQFVHGEAKAKILLKEGLIKLSKAKPKAEAAEAPAAT